MYCSDRGAFLAPALTDESEVAKMRRVIGRKERIRLGAAALLACALAACGSNDDGGGTTDTGIDSGLCGSPDNPRVLTSAEITDLEPAMGATVSNSAIVHRFKLQGILVAFQTTFEPVNGAHTAGNPVLFDADGGPTGTWVWTAANLGTSVQYEAAPMIWSQAPGHVELDWQAPQRTAAGCTFTFPTPFFSYDVVPSSSPGGEAGPSDAATE